MDKAKLNKIKRANELFLKRYKLEGEESVRIGTMSDNPEMGKIEYIKTGVIPIDLATGGLIKGKVNVWWGPKDSTKSTCVRDTISYIQKQQEDFVAGYVNSEMSMDREYWEAGGVDFERLLGLEFKTNEQALDYCNMCAAGTIPVDMLTIDTVQALACQGELGTEKKLRSMGDDTIALLARKYSQFLRTYTSHNVGNLSLLLIGQARTGGIGTMVVRDMMTGGNAIKHYNLVTLKISQAGKTAWPQTEVPENSFPVRFTVEKIKAMHRYKGIQVMGYFYKGHYDRRFNIVMIGADIGVHDGKSWKYKNSAGEEVEEKFRGKNEMFNKISDEGLAAMNTALEPTFLERIKIERTTNERLVDEDTTSDIKQEEDQE